MKKKVILSLLLVCVLIVSATACGGGNDGGSGGGSGDDVKTITLRLSSDAPLDHIATRLNEEACEMVFERTEGRVKVDLYPASQLGGYDTVFEEVMLGSIDMAQISWNAGVDQKLAVFNTPALTTGWEQAKHMYSQDSFMSQTYRDYGKEYGVEFLGWVLEGYMGLGMAKEPTDPLTPGTKKNVQIRVWGSPVCIDTMKDLGYNTVTVPYAEVPTAIQTGVVDGWIGGTPNINYAWVGQVIKQFYVNYLYAETTAYMISEKSMAKLSSEDQEILRDVFHEQSQKSFVTAQENEEEYLEKLTNDYGVEIVRLSQEQVQEQANFVRENTWPKLVDIIGQDIIDGLKADLAKVE